MASYNQNWDDLGRSIEELVDRAINSRDYRTLNQTICRTVDRAVDRGSEALRRAMDGVSFSEAGAQYTRRRAERPARAEQPAGPQTKDLAPLYGSTSGKTTAGIAKVVGGSLLSCVAFVLAIASLVLLFTGAGMGAIATAITLAGLGGGVWMAVSGIRTLGWVSRFRAYRRTLGQKTQCSLEKLARGVGKSVKFVRKELRQMIDAGLFLEGHMDREETCLITSDETYRLFEQSRIQFAQRQAAAAPQEVPAEHDPRVQEVLDRGNAFIAEIRRCNDAIPGEEISGKISRMEVIVQRIFVRAEAHPEIVPDLKKLMDYYLPMTVKLLNAYADMDAQPIQGENIQASKREIEDTLDTLNLAFEKLLDSVFKDTALDVSSDISVLHTLLAQEGLTEDAISGRKNQQTR